MFILLLVLIGCGPKTAPAPAGGELRLTAPDAEPRDHTHIEHGVERPDPYFWMRDRKDPAVLAYLEAENTYADAMTAHLGGFRTTLAEEMLARIREDDTDVPVRDGPWLYYDRTEAEKAYPIHCRRKGEEGEEEVFLDENVLAEGHDFLDVGNWRVSPSHQRLAYTTDHIGREKYAVHLVDLATGEPLSEPIADMSGNLAWADDETLFYTTLDASLRPDTVWRRTLGEAEPVLVFREEDPTFRVSVRRSRSEAYLMLRSASTLTTEYRVLSTQDPTGDLQVLSPRHRGHEYHAVHQGDRWGEI